MKKGFTLIELLAVILILGIIALIAIPAVNNIITDAKKGAAKVSVQSAINAYDQQYQIALLTEDPENIVATLDSTNGLSGADGDTVKTKLHIKGELKGTFTTLKFDDNKNVLVDYTSDDNIKCTNISDLGTLTDLACEKQ